MKPGYYTISEAADLLHVHPNTLRHWEKRNILVPTRDEASNYRYYSQEQIRAFLYRGSTPKVRISWTYHDAIRHRKEQNDMAQKTLDVCVSSLVTTPHDPKMDQTILAYNKESAERGVRLRFIRDLRDPDQKNRADAMRRYGIETRDRAIEGLTFAVIDKKIVHIEVPTDNATRRLSLDVHDEDTARSFSLFFELLWNRNA